MDIFGKKTSVRLVKISIQESGTRMEADPVKDWSLFCFLAAILNSIIPSHLLVMTYLVRGLSPKTCRALSGTARKYSTKVFTYRPGRFTFFDQSTVCPLLSIFHDVVMHEKHAALSQFTLRPLQRPLFFRFFFLSLSGLFRLLDIGAQFWAPPGGRGVHLPMIPYFLDISLVPH